ncbi:MAG: PAS domain-containing protein [Ilumatobacter sp.]
MALPPGWRRDALRELFGDERIDVAQDSICVTTCELDEPGPHIVYVSAGFTRLTGYDTTELLGHSPRRLQGPLSDRAVLNRLRTQLDNGESFHGETVNYRKDRTPFFMNWRVKRFDAGDSGFHVAFQTDSTDSVQSDRRAAAAALLAAVAGGPIRPGQIEAELASAHEALLGAGRAECWIDGLGLSARSSDRPVAVDPTIVGRAIEHGPVVNETTDRGTELVVACRVGNAEVVSRIADLSADHVALTVLDDHVGAVRRAAELATSSTHHSD